MVDQDVVKAACHCGSVQLEVKLAEGLRAPRRCNCSMCRMRGAVAVTADLDGVRILSGAEHLTEYRFNTGVARHLFCRHCGVKSFYVPRSNPDGYSINVRCLDPATIEHIEVETFDDSDREVSEARVRGRSR